MRLQELTEGKEGTRECITSQRLLTVLPVKEEDRYENQKGLPSTFKGRGLATVSVDVRK